MSETVPIWKLPEPVPVISRDPSAVSALAMKLSGNSRYVLGNAEKETV
jgi:hypothetical protein